MKDISVLFLSHTHAIPQIGHWAHTHDYWHFTLTLSGSILLEDGSILSQVPRCSCWPSGVINPPQTILDPSHSINIMFLVHNRTLSRKLALFPFSSLKGEELHAHLLLKIVEQARDLNPGQDFIDFAVGYYLHLLMATHNQAEVEQSTTNGLAELAISFIEENYMHQIKLEDVADRINRSPYHLSHMIKAATGMTVVELIKEVRVKNACRLLAYSSTPIGEIISSCGFISASYFHKVFKESVGTTPARYRTSHQVDYTFYHGDPAALDVPSQEPSYTYIPKAQKCVFWETPGKYFRQEIE